VAWNSLATLGAQYDIARFGANCRRFSPRQADLLIVVAPSPSGRDLCFAASTIRLCEPKWVIAYGVCASTGRLLPELFDHAGAEPGHSRVDIYFLGCPPRPEQMLDALVMLQERIQKGEGHSQVVRGPSGAMWPRRGHPARRQRKGKGRAARFRGRPWPRFILDRLPRAVRRGENPGNRIAARQRVGRRGAGRTGVGGAILRRRSCDALNMFIDLTCVDRLGRKPRFDVVMHCIPWTRSTGCGSWPDFPEDESLDRFRGGAMAGRQLVRTRGVLTLYGVRFAGHPDLRRILSTPSSVAIPAPRNSPRKGASRLCPVARQPGLGKPWTTRRHPILPRVVIGLGDGRPSSEADELPRESMPLNMGPSAPGHARGTVRMVPKRWRKEFARRTCRSVFLHRCFERKPENATWTQDLPLHRSASTTCHPSCATVGYRPGSG